jgi:hypothetical protein
MAPETFRVINTVYIQYMNTHRLSLWVDVLFIKVWDRKASENNRGQKWGIKTVASN